MISAVINFNDNSWGYYQVVLIGHKQNPQSDGNKILKMF